MKSAFHDLRCCSQCLLCLLCVILAGCDKLTDRYGRSDGKVGRESLNGFGALRTSFEKAGFDTRDISRLSDRVALTTTIVWTPQAMSPITADETRWFEQWLGRGGKTLIYIIPDSGSGAQYWQDAGKIAPASQRLGYRRREAREVNRQLMWRLNRQAVSSNGWFVLVPLEQKTEVSHLSSDWAIDRTLEVPFSAEYEIEFQDKDAVEVHNASLAGSVQTPNTGATGPNGGWVSSDEAEPIGSNYEFASLLSGEAMLRAKPQLTTVAQAASTSASPTPPAFEQRELIIAAKITNDDWHGSQIIVINSGSLLTNYAFTRQPNRQIAAQLIEAATLAGGEEKFAGFVTSSGSPIPVSDNNPGVPKATGMEMLTVWPISLITIHAVLFGLIVCLMLLPIFGRPRRIIRVHESSFADHLDAVAVLMRKTGGQQYARHRISEYMRRVRGENHGPWVIEQETPSRLVVGENQPNSIRPEPENVT